MEIILFLSGKPVILLLKISNPNGGFIILS